ncbi:IclR family transcriptional regulator [Actinoplanes subtropicus]|uniref:IclR family transcriptional regulator n=1 Tax=Actinoplanes subtropicus TaxID=543632 RepID=UPI0004C4019D|nr:IclR family transcriptional regulator [Actinoplanes subtropicus]
MSLPSGYRERNSTADRALDILMMFTETQPVISGNAVAERLGVARSTAYRYLQSLVTSRFLEEAPESGYRLGLGVLELGRLARRSYGLSEAAMPQMTALAEAVGETVLLTRRTGDLVVCVDRAEADIRAVRISYERGSSLPINAGASALVLLAWSPPEEARRLLDAVELRRFTSSTLTEVDAVMRRLEEIRRAGYSITRAELDPDVVGIAAPVRDERGQVVAAVSVVALESRVDAAAEAEIVARLLATAGEISDRLAMVAS